MTNILVCDDDKEIVEAISIYLSQEGYQIFKAYNGREAIEVLQKEDIQLLLIDIMMPEMDGLTAARIIRGMKGTDAGKIPIFAMNASAFANVVEAGRRAGMNEHLSKPSDETNMMRKIRGYITG